MSPRTQSQKRRRIPIPDDVASAVLTACRRRCCLCFALNYDLHTKQGQIAHLDHNPANNSPDNLAWLCLDHHDQYDGRTSQSKGLTIAEVKIYRSHLITALDTINQQVLEKYLREFPRAQEQRDALLPVPPVIPQHVDNRPPQIIIFEDNSSIAKLLTILIKDVVEDAEIHTPSKLQDLNQQYVTMVIVNEFRRKNDAARIVTHINERFPDAYVLWTTAYASIAHIRSLIEQLPIDNVLILPFEVEELIKAVQIAVTRQRKEK
jgi:CheY-like chemotaxis protein